MVTGWTGGGCNNSNKVSNSNGVPYRVARTILRLHQNSPSRKRRRSHQIWNPQPRRSVQPSRKSRPPSYTLRLGSKRSAGYPWPQEKCPEGSSGEGRGNRCCSMKDFGYIGPRYHCIGATQNTHRGRTEYNALFHDADMLRTKSAPVYHANSSCPYGNRKGERLQIDVITHNLAV